MIFNGLGCAEDDNDSNNPQCETRSSKEKCKEREECVFVMNSYYSTNHSECLRIDNSNDIKKFCGLFSKMNKEQGFNVVTCESALYNHESMTGSNIDQGYSSSGVFLINNRQNYLMLLIIITISLIL